jgi:hypothetical protein
MVCMQAPHNTNGYNHSTVSQKGRKKPASNWIVHLAMVPSLAGTPLQVAGMPLAVNVGGGQPREAEL